MESNEDLRLKRLNFYSKNLLNNSLQITKNEQEKKSKENLTFELKSNKKSTQEMQEKSMNLSQSKSDAVFDKIFGANEPKVELEKQENKPINLQIRRFSQSISFDENNNNNNSNYGSGNFDLFFGSAQSSAASSNRKLEEFKRILESSYQQHLQTESLLRQISNANDEKTPVKKTLDPLIKPTSQTLENSVQNPPLLDSVKSTDYLGINNLIESSIILQPKTPSDDLSDLNSSINKTAATVLPCKIPYMSAYNIYNPSSFQEDKLKNKSNEKTDIEKKISSNLKRLSSNGSSLTTSPTSTSSAESIRKEESNEFHIPSSQNNYNGSLKNNNSQFQIKPPDVPKTSNLSYRKNFSKTVIANQNSSNNALSSSLIVSNTNKNEIIPWNKSLNLNSNDEFDREENILEEKQEESIAAIDSNRIVVQKMNHFSTKLYSLLLENNYEKKNSSIKTATTNSNKK
jgi:hypothetical protein